jgi:hypothetical protein
VVLRNTLICGQSIRPFLLSSLNQQLDRLAPRELDLSDSLENGALALGYFCLLDERVRRGRDIAWPRGMII